MKKVAVLSQTINTPWLWLLFFLVDFPYQYGFRYLSLTDSLAYAGLDALLYTTILFVTTRFDLVRLTLYFLALPYLFFIPGWLNLPTAIALGSIFVFSLYRSLQATTALAGEAIYFRDVLAFLLILIWVNVSGIGGYGFQWADYAINNARLHDLVLREWPIRYGDNQNFVYYFGYFLPSAVIGKLFSIDVATRSVYLWAVLGVTLALRWLSHLSQWRYSACLVIIFILFGPIDILNLLYIKGQGDNLLTEFLSVFKYYDMDTLTFTTSQQLKFYSLSQQKLFFLGNYPGNSFQLYWSPQQLIAGWLVVALLMHLFLQKQFKHIVFVYTLLCLWGTLVMLALLPFVLLILLASLFKKYDLLSFENTFGAGSLALVFVIFYLAGSTDANPTYWLFEVIEWHKNWDLVLVFFLAAWLVYVLALLPYISQCDTDVRICFGALVVALAVLPLKIFGEWSDLLCRGSAPLMFLLLVFLLKAIHYYRHNHRPFHAMALCCLLIPGSASALLINNVSLMYYGQTEPVKSLLTYQSIYPNFGPDNTLFNKLFRHGLPGQNIFKSNNHE